MRRIAIGQVVRPFPTSRRLESRRVRHGTRQFLLSSAQRKYQWFQILPRKKREYTQRKCDQSRSCGEQIHLKQFGYPDVVPTQPAQVLECHRRHGGRHDMTVWWTRRFGQRAQVPKMEKAGARVSPTPTPVRARNRRVNRLPGATAPSSFNTSPATPPYASSSRNQSTAYSLSLTLLRSSPWLIDTPSPSPLSRPGTCPAHIVTVSVLFANLGQRKVGPDRCVPTGYREDGEHGLTSL
jgi:hypothetical protein